LIRALTTNYLFESGPFEKAESAYVHIEGKYSSAGPNANLEAVARETIAQAIYNRLCVIERWRQEEYQKATEIAESNARWRRYVAVTAIAIVMAFDVATIPSGEGVVASTVILSWARRKAVQAAVGSVLGGIDAHLNDYSIVTGMKQGSLTGMVFGSVGRLSTLAGRPGVALFFGSTGVMGGYGAYQSFQEGNYLGASFRTGLTAVSVIGAVRPGVFIKGSENDFIYDRLPLSEKYYYGIGQKTYKSLRVMDDMGYNLGQDVPSAVARGRQIVANEGWVRAVVPRTYSLGYRQDTFRTGTTALGRFGMVQLSVGAASDQFVDQYRAWIQQQLRKSRSNSIHTVEDYKRVSQAYKDLAYQALGITQ
jgi:hypothetical protein